MNKYVITYEDNTSCGYYMEVVHAKSCYEAFNRFATERSNSRPEIVSFVRVEENHE